MSQPSKLESAAEIERDRDFTAEQLGEARNLLTASVALSTMILETNDHATIRTMAREVGKAVATFSARWPNPPGFDDGGGNLEAIERRAWERGVNYAREIVRKSSTRAIDAGQLQADILTDLSHVDVPS